MTKSITLPTGWNGGGGGGGGAGPAGPIGPQGIAGVDGKTVRNGSGAPSGALGVDGDFYINTAAETIYGPKTAGAWGSPTSLVGPTGATGPAGSTGLTGAQGAKGDKGDTGSAGATGPAGPGVPVGGTTGQLLAKKSATDYDTEFINPPSGGGVASVDGRTGAVVLSDLYVDVTGDTMTGQLIAPSVALNVAAANTPALIAKVAGTTAAELRASAFGIGIGTGALQTASGAALDNVAVGTNALTVGTTGVSNTALGSNAGSFVTTGQRNTLIGYHAGNSGASATNALTTGADNVLIGRQAGLNSATQASNSIAIGAVAKVGSGNIAIGGSSISSGSAAVAIGISTQAVGANSIAVGNLATVGSSADIAIGASSSAAGANAIAIGHNVTAAANEIVMGQATNTTVLPGLGISFTLAAGAKLGINATQKLALWGATPVVQPAGWSATAGYTATKTFNPESTTLTEVARVLGTLVDTLKLVGLVGA